MLSSVEATKLKLNENAKIALNVSISLVYPPRTGTNYTCIAL